MVILFSLYYVDQLLLMKYPFCTLQIKTLSYFSDQEVSKIRDDGSENDESILTTKSTKPIVVKTTTPTTKDNNNGSKNMFFRHLAALTIKRFHHSKRNKKGVVSEVRIHHKIAII